MDDTMVSFNILETKERSKQCRRVPRIGHRLEKKLMVLSFDHQGLIAPQGASISWDFNMEALKKFLSPRKERGRTSGTPVRGGLLPLPDYQKGAGGRLHQRRLGQGGVETSMRPRSALPAALDQWIEREMRPGGGQLGLRREGFCDGRRRRRRCGFIVRQ